MVENLSNTFETILHYNPLITAKQKNFYQHEHKWQALIKMTCRGKSEQENQNRAERKLPNGEVSFIWLCL